MLRLKKKKKRKRKRKKDKKMTLAKKLREQIINHFIEFGERINCLEGVYTFLEVEGYLGSWFIHKKEEEKIVKFFICGDGEEAKRQKAINMHAKRYCPTSMMKYILHREIYNEYRLVIERYEMCNELVKLYSTFKHIQLFGYYADIPYSYIDMVFSDHVNKKGTDLPLINYNITQHEWYKLPEDDRERIIVWLVFKNVNIHSKDNKWGKYLKIYEGE